MALNRTAPTCMFCGEPTHKATYKYQSKIPVVMSWIKENL